MEELSELEIERFIILAALRQLTKLKMNRLYIMNYLDVLNMGNRNMNEYTKLGNYITTESEVGKVTRVNRTKES